MSVLMKPNIAKKIIKLTKKPSSDVVNKALIALNKLIHLACSMQQHKVIFEYGPFVLLNREKTIDKICSRVHRLGYKVRVKKRTNQMMVSWRNVTKNREKLKDQC